MKKKCNFLSDAMAFILFVSLDILFGSTLFYITVKKCFQDLLSQYFFFCQMNLNNLFSSDNLLF